MTLGAKELRNNPIYMAWKSADAETRYQALANICYVYNGAVCQLSQLLGKCKKEKREPIQDLQG